MKPSEYYTVGILHILNGDEIREDERVEIITDDGLKSSGIVTLIGSNSIRIFDIAHDEYVNFNYEEIAEIKRT